MVYCQDPNHRPRKATHILTQIGGQVEKVCAQCFYAKKEQLKYLSGTQMSSMESGMRYVKKKGLQNDRV